MVLVSDRDNDADHRTDGRRMSVTVAQMRAHIRQLCEANGIEINFDRHASASYLSDRNHVPFWRRRFGSGRSDRPVPMPLPCTRSATFSAAISAAKRSWFANAGPGIGQSATPSIGRQQCNAMLIGAWSPTSEMIQSTHKELTRPIGRGPLMSLFESASDVAPSPANASVNPPAPAITRDSL